MKRQLRAQKEQNGGGAGWSRGSEEAAPLEGIALSPGRTDGSGDTACPPTPGHTACSVAAHLQRVPEGELVDDVGHVRVLWLGRGTVCGHVEVARDLGREASSRSSVGFPGWGGFPRSQTDLNVDRSVVRPRGRRGHCPPLSPSFLLGRMQQ